MRSDAADPHRLDLRRLAEAADPVAGEAPLSGLSRLVSDAAPAGDGRVSWTVRGERAAGPGGTAQTWLHLDARATVRLTCQRCLQPLDEPLHVVHSYRFVADETAAEREDEDAEEDVLAWPARGQLDLVGLVEDELILALPLVPRHDHCPQPLTAPAQPDDGAAAARENPFAALAALKQGR